MSFYRDFNDKLAIQACNDARREPYRTIEVWRRGPLRRLPQGRRTPN